MTYIKQNISILGLTRVFINPDNQESIELKEIDDTYVELKENKKVVIVTSNENYLYVDLQSMTFKIKELYSVKGIKYIKKSINVYSYRYRYIHKVKLMDIYSGTLTYDFSTRDKKVKLKNEVAFAIIYRQGKARLTSKKALRIMKELNIEKPIGTKELGRKYSEQIKITKQLKESLKKTKIEKRIIDKTINDDVTLFLSV